MHICTMIFFNLAVITTLDMLNYEALYKSRVIFRKSLQITIILANHYSSFGLGVNLGSIWGSVVGYGISRASLALIN